MTVKKIADYTNEVGEGGKFPDGIVEVLTEYDSGATVVAYVEPTEAAYASAFYALSGEIKNVRFLDTDAEVVSITYGLDQWDQDHWERWLTWSQRYSEDYNREQAIYWVKRYKSQMPTKNFRVVKIITTETTEVVGDW